MCGKERLSRRERVRENELHNEQERPHDSARERDRHGARSCASRPRTTVRRRIKQPPRKNRPAERERTRGRGKSCAYGKQGLGRAASVDEENLCVARRVAGTGQRYGCAASEGDERDKERGEHRARVRAAHAVTTMPSQNAASADPRLSA